MPESASASPVLREAAPNLGLEEGSILADAYRLETILGMGGCGVVVRAIRLSDNRAVAIKLLRDLEDDAMAKRMLREANAVRTLRDRHFVEVLDVSESETMPFIVMECLEGETLSSRMRRARPGVDVSIGWILEVCEGLAIAHAHGIVHRDIKPSNVFLALDADGKESVKILDLGISLFANLTDDLTKITTTNAMLGSPAYSSPEQLTSPHHIDARADIWSLGVTLYRILGGVMPFSGESLPQVCASVFNSTPARLDQITPDVPRELAEVVARCLEKDRTLRFASVADLARALEPFADGRIYDVPFTPSASRTSPSVWSSPVPAEFVPTIATPGRRRPTLLMGGALVGIFLVAGVLFAARGARQESSPAAQVSTSTTADVSPSASSVPTSEPSSLSSKTPPVAPVPKPATKTPPRVHAPAQASARPPTSSPNASASPNPKDLGSYR